MLINIIYTDNTGHTMIGMYGDTKWKSVFSLFFHLNLTSQNIISYIPDLRPLAEQC